tara:strand:- start:890 stop:1135 length:246 start_codon:yes stop_codon:yes gene_type:complete
MLRILPDYNLSESQQRQADYQIKMYKMFPIGGVQWEITTMAEGGCPGEFGIKREEYYPNTPDEYFMYICDAMGWKYNNKEE